ncbi:MAG: CRISPR system precrRNA processing endoribonuclease RAMP protein Cas6 [Bryobacteraceae bacterium]|nr:CRISPR system precrRNA processing endoribonuclease RAMP protein Cas6 [Bryobacteraceae bacterium]
MDQENSKKVDEAVKVLPLSLSRYRFRFRAERALPEYGYRGSQWRGILGHSLKKLVCITHHRNCGQCMLYRSCVYPYVFETPPSENSEMMRKYPAAPHPYVLEVNLRSAAGVDQELGLTLFGAANRYLAYVIHSFKNGARKGFLPERTPLELVRVEQETEAGSGCWQPILNGDVLNALAAAVPACPQAPERVRFRFETPLRLKADEQRVTPDKFKFSDLFRNLLRRISLLTFFHCNRRLEEDFAGLNAMSRDAEFDRVALRWHDWSRYSNRQRRHVPMGGFIGVAELPLRGFESLWPYLWLGQFTHAGQGTSMGLGRYALEVL